MMNNWPFKYFNGVQTPESLALQARSAGQDNKGEHTPTPINLNDFEEALL